MKHLLELTRAAHEGYCASIAFVIQMDGVTEVRPNMQTHPEFGAVLAAGKESGVRILFLPCHVEPDEIYITDGII